MLDKSLTVLNVIPMILTIVYFLNSAKVYQMLKRIKKENGLFIMIIFIMLSIGCWQLFWLVHLSPSIADSMKRS